MTLSYLFLFGSKFRLTTLMLHNGLLIAKKQSQFLHSNACVYLIYPQVN